MPSTHQAAAPSVFPFSFDAQDPPQESTDEPAVESGRTDSETTAEYGSGPEGDTSDTPDPTVDAAFPEAIQSCDRREDPIGAGDCASRREVLENRG